MRNFRDFISSKISRDLEGALWKRHRCEGLRPEGGRNRERREAGEGAEGWQE